MRSNLASLILFISTLTLSAQPKEYELSLKGRWKLLVGESAISAELLKPTFDDSNWGIVDVPLAWDKQKQFEGFSGFGVYRKSIVVPIAAKGRALTLALGKIASVDETYFNGELIGKTGEVTIGADLDDRFYPIPDSLIQFGKINTIAVRVFSKDRGGGIYEGIGNQKNDIGIYSKTALRKRLGKPSTLANKTVSKEIEKVIHAMDRLLFSGKTEGYSSFIAEGYFNNGTSSREQMMFIQSIQPSLNAAKADYQDFVVYELSENHFLADYETKIYKDGKLFYTAHDERHFAKIRSVWKEIGNQSRLFEISVRSIFMSEDVRVLIYLPPSFMRKSSRKYPSLFLLPPHGATLNLWREIGINRVLDSLIISGEMKEMIVVMPDERGSYFVNSFDGKKRYQQFFYKELIESVEEDYRAFGDKAHRAITGISWGGSAAFFLALKGDEGRNLFGSISATMPMFNRQFNERHIDAGNGAFWGNYNVTSIIDSLSKNQLSPFTFHITTGSEDYFRPATLSVSQTIKSKTSRLTLAIEEGGNTYEFWVKHLTKALMFHSSQFEAVQE